MFLLYLLLRMVLICFDIITKDLEKLNKMNSKNNENNQRRNLGSKKSTKTTTSNPQYEGLINGTRKFKFFNVSKGEVGEYYLVDIDRASVFKVTQTEFAKREGCVIKKKQILYRCLNGTRNQMRDILSKYNFVSESAIKDFWDGINSLISAISFIGSSSKKLHAIKDKITNDSVLNFLLSLSNTLLQVVKAYQSDNFSMITVLELLLSIYRSFIDGSKVYEIFKANSIPTVAILLSMASMILPKNVFEIFKRMSAFTTSKVLDDASGFYKVIICIIEFFNSIIEYIPFKLPEFLTNMLAHLLGYKTYVLLYEGETLYNNWIRNKKLMLEADFRNAVKIKCEQVMQDNSLIEWSKKSKATTIIVDKLTRLVKATQAYENSARVEPCCFIFEGPPGVKKSVFMNNLVQTMNVSAYVHSTKTSTDGKDFYDSYNNETIFLMDDVGQQGLSQWRNIINMVAPVKLPLECAAVELKDTKFFCSDLILLTTNAFINIHGLSKTDGISDVNALWRRGYVFDFQDVRNVDNNLQGTIKFKYFSVSGRRWIHGFPHFFKNDKVPKEMDVSVDFLKILAWMKFIITNFNEIKKQQYSDNLLTDSQISLVDDYSKEFEAQTFVSSVKQLTGMVVSYWESIIDDMLHYITECLATIDFSAILMGISSGVIHVMYSSLPSIIVFSLVTLVTSCRRKPISSIPAEANVILNDCVTKEVHPSVSLIQRQTFQFRLKTDSGSTESVCLISGRCVITIAHISDEKNGYLTVYKNKEKTHIIIDQIFVQCVYRDVTSDISVWSLPNNYPTPFKNLSSSFNISDHSKETYFIHPDNVLSLSMMRSESVEIPTPYSIILSSGKEFKGVIKPTDIAYSLHYQGLCGSPIVSNTGKFLGMHVAGSDQLSMGIALRLTEKTISDLNKILSGNFLSLNVDLSDKTLENFSGIKLNTNISVHTPHNSKLIPSPLHGVFPVEKFPAELSKYGPHTVKDVAKKSFKPVFDVNSAEIEFGKKVLLSIIDDFDDLPMNQVINGNDFLAGINKDSSNGLFAPKGKKECIDYENGKLTNDFSKEYQAYLSKIESGVLSPEDVVWSESLKDETRPKGKDPRSFRVSRIHMQILTKSIFGKMVEQIIKERSSNKIMIGVNPYKEWNNIYDELKPHLKWAGDIKLWDGNMLAQVQHAMHEVFSIKYKGNKKFMNFITGCINYCLVVVNDDSYLTTHSMPSGSFLTAILNSLINRFYTAMWYYRNMKDMKPTVNTFNRHILDYVYGDDKVNALKDARYKDRLNAITMKEFFVSIGMDFTDSTKGEITEPFQLMDRITFLKRNFEYHPILQRVVGPLDYTTIYSSVSWLDSTKDFEVVIDGKLSAFQRECFLHWDTYKENIRIMKMKCEEAGVTFNILPIHYLVKLYVDEDYQFTDNLYGSF